MNRLSGWIFVLRLVDNSYFAEICYSLEHLLFAGYLILFAWLATRIRFFTKSGLSPAQLIIIFLLKVMAGIIYGWIGVYYGNLAQMVDTWSFHYDSINEHRVLMNDPQAFFRHFFNSSYKEGYGGFLSENTWWADVDIKLITKLLAFFNIFSLGHYYINIVFYSFLTLFGPIAFYRIMNDYFRDTKIANLVSVFLIPSFLYWTSGIHKEGLIFLAIALIMYCFYFGFLYQWTWKKTVIILLCLLLLLVLRNYVLIALVPALTAWVIAKKTRFHPALVFGTVYAAFILMFFTARYFHPRLDFPAAVASKQEQFLKLKGNSSVPTTRLDPTFASFVLNAPQAINLSLVRPYPSDINHLLSMAAAIEINLLLFIFVIFLLWHRRRPFTYNPFILFCIFFSFSVLMTIGYTVNFLGAIVRYRSIIFPILFVPVVAKVQWEKIGEILLNIKTKNNI